MKHGDQEAHVTDSTSTGSSTDNVKKKDHPEKFCDYHGWVQVLQDLATMSIFKILVTSNVHGVMDNKLWVDSTLCHLFALPRENMS